MADSSGQAISNVNIIVSGPTVQGLRGGTSDKDGHFVLRALPTGIVSVRMTHVQYQPLIFEDVSIELGRTTSLGEVRLRARLHDLPEIVVSESRPLIDPNTTSSGANLRSSDFESLPIERNYRNIAALIPQANTSYYGDEVNVGGATGSENGFFVDGIDVTDPHFGALGTNLPYNFVQEIEVLTGGYEAEYRSSLGGTLNAVTFSGSNELQGSVYGFFTNNRLTTPSRVGPLDPTQGGFSNYDAGVTFGGPIILDELWFFAAYNPIFNRRNVDVPGFGTYVDETVTNSFAGKIAWRTSQNLRLVLLLAGDPSNRTAVGEVDFAPSVLENVDPYITRIKTGGVNIAVNGSYFLGDDIFLDASISRITRDQITGPATERGRNEIAFIDQQTGAWSGGSFLAWSALSSSTTARLAGTILAGSHILKGGFEYRNKAVEVDGKYSYMARIDDTTYFQLINRDLGTVHNRIPSFFLQDEWRIHGNLRFHAGVRWDGQFLIATNGKIAQKITDQFQPRVGFVFLPGGEGNQKVYGSFGRFTEELSTNLSATLHSDQGHHYQIYFDQDPRIGTTIGDTAVNLPHRILPEVKCLQGQYFDEFSLGYERMITTNLKIGVQGIHRTLREAVAGVLSQGNIQLGNPGRGVLKDFPGAQRDYTALVLTLEQRGRDRFNFLASYVLSRNYGNYPGLYNVYYPSNGPNTSLGFFEADGLRNATGLLPNDRTHVLKFSGSYRFDFGLTIGTQLTWQSGTPLSELAKFGWFLTPRGTAGRTAAIWDLNARMTYPLILNDQLQARLILDVFHIASQRKPVNIVQQHYFDVDSNGNPFGLNPNYGLPSRHQPPMSLRIGMDISF